MWTRFVFPRIGSSSGLLWTRQITLWSILTEWASQQGLCLKEFVTAASVIFSELSPVVLKVSDSIRIKWIRLGLKPFLCSLLINSFQMLFLVSYSWVVTDTLIDLCLPSFQYIRPFLHFPGLCSYRWTVLSFHKFNDSWPRTSKSGYIFFPPFYECSSHVGPSTAQRQ